MPRFRDVFLSFQTRCRGGQVWRVLVDLVCSLHPLPDFRETRAAKELAPCLDATLVTTYFYDKKTDTLRKYGHLTAGPDVGERFCHKTLDWSSDCCRRAGCKWDEVVTEQQAIAIYERQQAASPSEC